MKTKLSQILEEAPKKPKVKTPIDVTLASDESGPFVDAALIVRCLCRGSTGG